MANYGMYSQDDFIVIGGGDDFCYLCAKELKAKDREELNLKLKNLKNEIIGKKIFRLRVHSEYYSICPKHMMEYAIKIKEDDEENGEH